MNNNEISAFYKNTLAKIARKQSSLHDYEFRRLVLYLVFYRFLLTPANADIRDVFKIQYHQVIKNHIGNFFNDTLFNLKSFFLKLEQNNIHLANIGALEFFQMLENKNKDGELSHLAYEILQSFDTLSASYKVEATNSLWKNLFEYILYNDGVFDKNLPGSFSTPTTLGSLIGALVPSAMLNKNISLHDPTMGVGKLLLSVGKTFQGKVSYFGQEIMHEDLVLAKMNFIINGVQDFDLRSGNTLSSPAFTNNNRLSKFDIVVSQPPFGCRNWRRTDELFDVYNRWNDLTGLPSNSSADSAFILHALSSLKNNGTAVIIVPSGFGFRSNSDMNIRKYLIENGFLTAVISLPEKIFPAFLTRTDILILQKNHNNHNKGVFMIEAKNEFESTRFFNYFNDANIEKIAESFQNKNPINGFSKWVTLNEFRENMYGFQTYKYFPVLSSKEIPADYELRSLSKMLKVLKLDSSKAKMGHYLPIKDMSNDAFAYVRETNSIEIQELPKGVKKLEKPALLLSRIGTNLKPTFVAASSGNPIFVSPEVLALELKSEDINLSYLVSQLHSDLVAQQVNARAFGAALVRLTAENILDIQVLIPSLQSQNSSLIQKTAVEAARRQADLAKIKNFQLEETINKLLQERTNDFQWQLHDLRNGELYGVGSQLALLKKYCEKNPEELNQPLIPGDKDSLRDIIMSTYKNFVELRTKLDELYSSNESFGSVEKIELIDFLINYFNNLQEKYKNLFSFVFPNQGNYKRDNNILGVTISANRRDIERVIDNIVENAITHGGFRDNIGDNKFLIDLNLHSKDFTVTVEILNNGNRSEISESDYFSDGGKQGAHAKSGKGGKIVKELIIRNGGTPFQYSYDAPLDDEYTFGVGFTFPLESLTF